MSDDTQVLDRNPVSSPVSGNVVAPLGSVNKEAPNLPEFVRPAGTELSPNPSPEEKKSGVEVKNDNPNLTFEHKGLIDHAGASTPIQTALTGKLNIMTQEEIAANIQSGDDTDSKKALAKLLDKVKKAVKWLTRG